MNVGHTIVVKLPDGTIKQDHVLVDLGGMFVAWLDEDRLTTYMCCYKSFTVADGVLSPSYLDGDTKVYNGAQVTITSSPTLIEWICT